MESVLKSLKRLEWRFVQGKRLEIMQQKTKDSIYLNLCEMAHRAGIEKNISFHTARHTFATMSLTRGVDLYTVSKLLGHTDIKNTQIYARVIDQKMVEAVERLPQFKIS